MGKRKRVVIITCIFALIALLSGCFTNRHTYEVQEGIYFADSLSQTWNESFNIHSISLEITSITEETYEEAFENVFYTYIDSKKYYSISITIFDETDNHLEVNLQKYILIDQPNAYAFSFIENNEDQTLKAIFKVDGDEFNDDLNKGALCNGLEVIFDSESLGSFSFNLEIDVK